VGLFAGGALGGVIANRAQLLAASRNLGSAAWWSEQWWSTIYSANAVALGACNVLVSGRWRAAWAAGRLGIMIVELRPNQTGAVFGLGSLAGINGRDVATVRNLLLQRGAMSATADIGTIWNATIRNNLIDRAATNRPFLGATVIHEVRQSATGRPWNFFALRWNNL
jgi:hypothetical protein